MQKYPRLGEKWTARPKGLCKICNEPKSDSRVEVQVDIFRGNDEVYKVHTSCIKGLYGSELLERLTVGDN